LPIIFAAAAISAGGFGISTGTGGATAGAFAAPAAEPAAPVVAPPAAFAPVAALPAPLPFAVCANARPPIASNETIEIEIVFICLSSKWRALY
jgi:hypothetical protein